MKLNRRDFVKGASLMASALAMGGCKSSRYPKVTRTVAPRLRGANDKLNIGVIGVGGKGWSDWTPMFRHGENIVALCDADKGMIERGLAEIAKAGKPKPAVYTDYRKMLDDFSAGKFSIDAVTVSTPDHTHAPAAIRAMKLGCGAYVQKPLVRTIWEAHYFEKVAKTCGVVTQMGNQGSAGDGLRRNVELLQMGILGNVKEVHVWTNRPIWPQGPKAEASTKGPADAIPEKLDWESWIGTAPMRNFKNGVYHTFKWRGFFDFGTGAFGDMACHTMNVPFRGLELGEVTNAECIMIEGKNAQAYPDKSIVKLTYAARKSRVRKGVALPAVDLYWYDGNLKPKAEIMPAVIATLGAVPNTGCLIIGDKGMLVSTNDNGQEAYIALNGEKKMKSTTKHDAAKAIKEFIPRNKVGHYIEFVNACKGIGPVYDEVSSRCYSDVGHSVPMLEAMLVGCIAQQVKGRLAWDSANQLFNCDAANALVKPFIRRGFEF